MAVTVKKTCTIWLEPDWLDRIDRLAKKADISRSKLVENIVKINLEELEMMDKVGLYKMSIIFRDLQEGIKAWREGINDDPERQAELAQGIVTPA